MGGKKLTGWGKNGPAYFFPGERMGRPILSPGKKLTGGKFRPVTPVTCCPRTLNVTIPSSQKCKKMIVVNEFKCSVSLKASFLCLLSPIRKMEYPILLKLL